MTLNAGARLGPYEILGPLGVGGMGEVYSARDTRLQRTVAVKVLSPQLAADEEFRLRFEREARAASALDHPHICTIYDVGQAEGRAFLVMQHVQGETLAARIAADAVSVSQALEYSIQIASALAAAHGVGIVHRDLKPANVMVTTNGVVKILDFGLAKQTQSEAATETAETGATTPSPATLTRVGTVLGTVAYMSPEQVEGRLVDARSDVFSFGAVLYEMLTGRRAFQGDSMFSTAVAIVRDHPPHPREIRRDIPPNLERIVLRCLEKAPEERYASGALLHASLVACQAHLGAAGSSRRSSRRARLVIAALAVITSMVAAAAWTMVRAAWTRRAAEQTLPEIARLSEQGQYAAAYRLAADIERHLPGEHRLTELMREVAAEVSIETQPAGAEIRVREYADPAFPSQFLGRSPIKAARIARGLKRWTISKPGFRSVEAARSPDGDGPTLTFVLDTEATLPPEMVRVEGGVSNRGLTGLDHLSATPVDDFFIDRHEVTNREYAEFVRAGGYRRPEFWKHVFVKDGRVTPFEEAMKNFVDVTGRPGPATWELGNYPAGQKDFPVAGVSWFEAAAYAAFAGKELPTVQQWQRAAFRTSLIQNGLPVLRLSNFGDRPVAVGSRHAMNPHGTFDMAGNVKEWCWNAVERRGGAHYILGGGFSEPVYMSHDPDAQSPWQRLPSYGFRCVKHLKPASAAFLAPIDYPGRDYARERPVPDNEFLLYRRFYAYDRTDLDARTESVDDGSPLWRVEKISFNAAYGGERMTAYLLLPRNVDPPYQTVIYFPGSGALRERSSHEARLKRELAPDQPLGAGPAFLVRSGRAVLYPTYKSTWERGDGLLSDRPNMTSWFRDHVVQWQKDVARGIDYLESRRDIDTKRLGYIGLSWGATMGPIVLALEQRLKAAVLVVGGFWQQKGAPEVEQINFAPRVTMPVLMLNGRYDFVFPLATSQEPMFQLLGTPAEHKRHVLLESGHSVPARALVTHTLQWFDRYLDPVR